MAAVVTLPLGAIVGIAIAGTTALLFVVVSTGIHLLRKRDKKIRAKLLNVEAQPLETKELAAFLRSERPRDDYIPNSLNGVPSLPPHRRAGSVHVDTSFPGEIADDEPPLARANTKRLSPTRALSRLSTGIRDSWPLTNSGQMPNALHGLARLQSQSQSTITLNQVAPPGYLITSDPKYPNRTYSRKSKTKVPKDVARHHRPLQTVTKHSSQLTTILRSTSERLKPSHSRRKGLSRTLTSFNRPGPPPSERAPSPNRRVRVKESREALIDNRSTVSIDSSIFDEQVLRSPSQGKRIARKTGRSYSKRDVSPPSPSGTDDSLCCVDPRNQVVTAPLCSPSKQSRADQKMARTGISPVRMSPVETRDYPSMLKKGNRASVQALSRPLSEPSSTQDQDPFFTKGSRSSNTTEEKVIEPRPLFIRKSTSSLSKPTSPLKDISGNSQTPTNRDFVSVSFAPQHNPFQWSPQEVSRSSPSNTQPRKKGHKRSKIVRMSVLPVAQSSVSVVPEESEESDSEISPFKFHAPPPGVRRVEPSKSPSPSPRRSLLQRRQHNRPASTLTFDPHIHIPPKIPMGRTMNSTLGDIQIYSPTMASPTRSSPARLSPIRLSPMRLSTTFTRDSDSKTISGDTFFSNNPKLSPSTTHSRHECSIAPVLSPTNFLDEMIGFPRPPTTVHSHKPKQSINFVPASFSVLPTTKPIMPAQIRTSFPQPSNSPALSPNSEILKALEDHKIPQPVLTLPCIPGHLTGPREPPPKFGSPMDSAVFSQSPSPSPSRSQTQKLPRRDSSLHQSISMLRRMNSDVSRYDSPTSAYSRIDRSLSPSPVASNFRDRSFKRETGSRYYHNISNLANRRHSASSGSKNRISKHSSTAERRISKILTSRNLTLEREVSLRKMSSETETEYIVDATPLDPSAAIPSSPITEPESDLSAVELCFPLLSRAGIVEYSLPDLVAAGVAERDEILELESPVRVQNWSDNIPKNSYPIQSFQTEAPGTWNKIVLTPKGEESKENAVPRNSVVRKSVVSFTDEKSARDSIVSIHDRRSKRHSVINSMGSPGIRNSASSGNRKSEVKISVASPKDASHHGVDARSDEMSQKKKESSVKHPPRDKASPNKLRKKPGTIWSNWNASPRDSLYDSDGFLRSSPTRLSGCT